MAPNMGAGGSHSQAAVMQEERPQSKEQEENPQEAEEEKSANQYQELKVLEEVLGTVRRQDLPYRQGTTSRTEEIAALTEVVE